jgi:FAD/FMN-containing dehydrogenase
MSLTELPVIEPPASRPGQTADFAGWLDVLRQSVTGEVRFDRLTRALYATDASVYQIVPIAVVLPRTEADVLATVRACVRFGVPLTARGPSTACSRSIRPNVGRGSSRDACSMT